MSIQLVMPSSHLILCRPLLLLPPTPRSIRVFFNKSTLHMRWPEYWSFSFSIIPSKEHPGLISFRIRTGWISLQSKGLSRVFSNTTVQNRQFFGAQLSSQSNFHIHTSDQISRSVVSDSLRPHELQNARPPCPSPTPGVHVHQVSVAIQPSHPLLSPFPPAPNPSQHQSLFQ